MDSQTCKNVVDLVYNQVSILYREAHGRLEFEHIAMRSVSAEQDVLLFKPEMKEFIRIYQNTTGIRWWSHK